MHLLIDFETLGNQYTGKVVSAAILVFDQNKVEQISDLMESVLFYQFNYKNSEQTDWLVEQSYVDWWRKQSKDIQEKSLRITENSKTLEQFVSDLNEIITKHWDETSFIWSRGNGFDFPILDRVLRKMNLCVNPDDSFYNVFKQRDIRTLVDSLALATGRKQSNLNGYISDLIPRDYNKLTHDPTFDVARDAFLVQSCYKIFQE